MVCAFGSRVIRDDDHDVIKWQHFPRYWPFVRGIHQSPVNSPHKGQWCGALMFSLICAWINCWVYNREAGDFRRHRAQYDVIVMHRNQPSYRKNQGYFYGIWGTEYLVPLQVFWEVKIYWHIPVTIYQKMLLKNTCTHKNQSTLCQSHIASHGELSF